MSGPGLDTDFRRSTSLEREKKLVQSQDDIDLLTLQKNLPSPGKMARAKQFLKGLGAKIGARLKSAPAASVQFLRDAPTRWAGFRERTGSTIIMIAAFLYMIYLGPPYLVAMLFGIQFMMFKEIVAIGQKDASEQRLPGNRFLSWWFFAVTVLFLYPTFLKNHLAPIRNFFPVLSRVFLYHSMIVFGLWCLGFLIFVVRLKKSFYKYQFKQFAWAHCTCLVVVAQSSVLIHNLYAGMYWGILPCLLIITNDIMAYIFGFFFGKTPLIKLSPKKTWEGFIGGFVSTIAVGFLLSDVLARFPFMYCSNLETYDPTFSCAPDHLFIPQVYHLPNFLSELVGFPPEVSIRPVQWHTIALAMFASIVAPFGGFFASGFKRAMGIKDFGETIPGHGGVTDRMDCQVIMVFFVFVYFKNFIREVPTSPLLILSSIVRRPLSDQLEIFRGLYASLIEHNVTLPPLPASL